ncbi:MAG TPA: energy transducer TonB, partial [Gammaproteobacteria bacterium]
NHVIVAVQHDGRTYWLDPTIQYQRGGLNAVYQPDYGYALVLKPGAAALTPAAPQQAPSGSETHEVFDLTAGKDAPTPFTVRTRTYGMNAENVRRRLAGSGRKTLEDDYLGFYKDYYPGIETDGDAEFTDHPERNEMIVEERYAIDALWEFDKDDNNYDAWFYPNALYHHLKPPKQQQRKHPLALAHPVNSRHVIELKLDDQGWRFDDEVFSEDNAFFTFSHNARFNAAGKILTLEYAYRSKTDHVPVESYDVYRQALERVQDYKNYGIYSNFTAASADTSVESDEINYVLWIILGWALMLVAVIVLWRIDARRHPLPADTLYYPVSPPKFIAMWMLTGGLYGLYWFYKNWRYVKQRDQSGIMPVARGIFLHFWYYPLYEELHGDSVKRYGKAQLPPLAVGGVLAAAFLVLYIAGNLAGYELAATLVAMLLVLPLVNYINHAGGNDSAAYKLNSRWRVRHYLLILLTGPLLVITLGSEIGLMPSDRVIAGSKLLSYDIRFLQRKGAIAPGDEIVYFYSDAFLSNREDGNGYSDRHVFSYWMENGDFNLQSAAYTDIKDIQVNWSDSWDDNTVIEIIRHDDSKFILYAAHTDKKDKVFVNGLMKRWKNTTPRPALIEGDGELQRIEGVEIIKASSVENAQQAGSETTGNTVPYKPLIKEPPEYPLAALQAGIEGHVILEFTITHTGSVEDIKVVEAEPEGVFENAAIEAARKFRYSPQYINDEPVDTSGVRHLLSFKLAPES